MSGLASDYIDLLASGDKEKILCVLTAAGSAAAISGVAAGMFFAPANMVPGAGQAMNATAAGIGAVLGALLAGRTAYGICGGETTRGEFQGLFSAGKINSQDLKELERLVAKEFDVLPGEARMLVKAAYVYSARNVTVAGRPKTTPTERKNAVAFLLKKMSDKGVA